MCRARAVDEGVIVGVADRLPRSAERVAVVERRVADGGTGPRVGQDGTGG
jgi:hypothetical protein